MAYEIKKDKRKGKSFNFADIVILLAILCVIAFIAYTVLSSYASDFFEKKYEVEYTVKLSEIRKDFAGNVKAGDKIVETETLSEIGTVSEVHPSPCTFTSVDSKGNTVTSDNPLYIDMVITVKASASLPDGIYTVNKFRLTAGKDISFRVPNFTGKGVCTGIKEVADNEK